MIEWSFLQAKQSKIIEEVFVSTDDQKIIELSGKYNVKSIKRPMHLAGDSVSSESALIHAIDKIKKIYNINPEIIVFLQATSPLRKKNDIDDAISKFVNKSADSLFSVTSFDDLTLWKRNKDKWESINFDYKNRLRRQDMPLNYVENGSIYIFKKEILEKFKNRIGGKIISYDMDFWQTWELDTIEEVDLIEFYMKKHIIGDF